MKGLIEGWKRFKARLPKRRRRQTRQARSIQAGLRPLTQTTENIVGAIMTFVRRFVFLENEVLYLLVGVWIISTYLCQEFDYSGYLFAYSPEPQSGKTTLLDVLDLLVANSSGIQIAPTRAILFRTANAKTQLLDEIDTWMNHEELRSVLNAGFQKGAKVTRIEKDSDSGLKPHEYSIYGSKALAGIGLNTLTRATRDRTFAMPMVRQKKGERRERFRLRLVKKDAEALKQRISDWATEKRDAVISIYNQEERFPDLDQFADRTVDIAEPLAAIVEVAFAGEQLAEVQARLVQAIRITRNEQQSLTAEHRLLSHLLKLTETVDPLVGNASEFAKLCGNLAEPPNEQTIGRVLRTYGFEPKSIRKPGEDPKYRYVLSRKVLQEIVDRWAGEQEKEVAEGVPASNVVDVVSPQADHCEPGGEAGGQQS
jgi:Protein of unknown function (DUF3631)